MVGFWDIASQFLWHVSKIPDRWDSNTHSFLIVSNRYASAKWLFAVILTHRNIQLDDESITPKEVIYTYSTRHTE
jgi:hypothetical protein